MTPTTEPVATPDDARADDDRLLVVTWNVNSLRARMPRVLELLETHQPDIVCLQETKTAPEQFPHLELLSAGYAAADHSTGRWAGVAILAREDTPPEDVLTGLPGEPLAEEGRWIEATVDGVRIASTYVVNGRSLDDPMFAHKLDMLDAMQGRIGRLVDGPALVAGDFNVCPSDEDIWDPAAFVNSTHASPDERARLQGMLDAGMDDAWLAAPTRGEHRYTWWDYRAGHFHKNYGLRIDLVLTSADLTRRLSWIGIDRDFRKGPKPSDHAPLLVRFGPERDG